MQLHTPFFIQKGRFFYTLAVVAPLVVTDGGPSLAVDIVVVVPSLPAVVTAVTASDVEATAAAPVGAAVTAGCRAMLGPMSKFSSGNSTKVSSLLVDFVDWRNRLR